MKENKEHILVEPSDGKTYLPLYDFFIALKQNNFLVTPKQIIDSNSIVDRYSENVKNEHELCNYLSPIFANSQEEQIQFKEIFEQYFKEAIKQPEPTPVKRWQKIPGHFKKHWGKYALVLLLTILVVIIINRLKPIPVPRPSIFISANFSDLGVKGLKNPVASNPNSQIEVQLHIGDQLADTVPGLTLKSKFNWGDNTAGDTLRYHIYNAEGYFTITVYVDVYLKNTFQFADTADAVVGICFESKGISIRNVSGKDSIKINEQVKLEAVSTGKKPDSILWTSVKNKKLVENGYGKELIISFDKEGMQPVYCTPIYDSADSPCTAQSSISFFVYDPKPKPQIIFSVPAGANSIAPKYKIKQNWLYLLGTLAIISLFFTVFFALRWNRSKKNTASDNKLIQEEYEKLIQSFSGKTGTADLPFLNKNYLPLPEPEIGDVARQMRKRINDDASYLHLQKTIARAIENSGFFQPVLSSRTQQSEYLVLIDENNSKSQQVKLFEYLLELLAKQNVFIEKYYYQQEPKLCYCTTQPNGISLEKLSEKYPKHVLLIFGDAYQLIYQHYPVMDSSYLQLLRRWQYKAVVTPVSFLDWGNKEKKALLDELPVLPVDIPGQILLLQKLFEEEINIIAGLKQYSKNFYETEMIDFEDVDELYVYCENAAWANVSGGGKYSNILFQWIAALAVYPKIQWQLTIAIGKAIMDKYGKSHEMNFTSLLRIARIKWMKDGKFPDYSRLDLLKNLSKENEVIARETILTVLNEIPEADLNTHHFAYEEKETQRLINEFNLYAYDPVKYAAYKKSRELVAQLWHNSKITDIPVQTYIENKDLKWDTIINKPVTRGELVLPGENIPVQKYFGDGPVQNTFLTRFYLWCTSISSLLFLTSLIGGIILLVLNFTGNKKITPFTYEQSFNKEIKFNYTDTSGSKLVNNVVLTVDTALTNLYTNKLSTLLLLVNDSLKRVSVTVDDDIIFDTVTNLLHDAYTIALIKNKITDTVQPIDTAKIILASLPVNLHEIWQGKTSNRLINIDLRKKIIYYSTGGTSTYGIYPISIVTKTKLGAYKIVSTTNRGSSVMFIRKVNNISFEFSGCRMLVQDKAEIEKINESNCGNFDVMSLYYDTEVPTFIYLPVIALNGQPKPLALSEYKKLSGIIANAGSKAGNPEVELRNNLGYLVKYTNTFIAKYLLNAGVTIKATDVYNRIIDENSINPFRRSLFTVYYNAVEPPAEKKDVDQDKDVKQDNAPNNNTSQAKKILWVDDNPNNNSSLIDYLKKASYSVDIVNDNETALNFISKNNYEIIITDIGRDKESANGIDLLNKLPAKISKEDVIIYTSPIEEKKYSGQLKKMGYYQVIIRAADLIEIVNKRLIRQSTK